MVDIQCAAAEIKRGKKEEEEDRKKPQHENTWCALFHRATIINTGQLSYIISA